MAIIVRENHQLSHDLIKNKLKPVEQTLKSKSIQLNWISDQEASLGGSVNGKLRLETQAVELRIESNFMIKMYGEKKLEDLIRAELKKHLV
jgi:hypothetical protein